MKITKFDNESCWWQYLFLIWYQEISYQIKSHENELFFREKKIGLNL